MEFPMRLREVTQLAEGYCVGGVRQGWDSGFLTLSPAITPLCHIYLCLNAVPWKLVAVVPSVVDIFLQE